jgi:hypothetical protein
MVEVLERRVMGAAGGHGGICGISAGAVVCMWKLLLASSMMVCNDSSGHFLRFVDKMMIH